VIVGIAGVRFDSLAEVRFRLLLVTQAERRDSQIIEDLGQWEADRYKIEGCLGAREVVDRIRGEPQKEIGFARLRRRGSDLA
jgi:hypothetical protein